MAEQGMLEHLQLRMEADGVILVEQIIPTGWKYIIVNTFNNAYMEYSVDITYVAYDGAVVVFSSIEINNQITVYGIFTSPFLCYNK